MAKWSDRVTDWDSGKQFQHWFKIKLLKGFDVPKNARAGVRDARSSRNNSKQLFKKLKRGLNLENNSTSLLPVKINPVVLDVDTSTVDSILEKKKEEEDQYKDFKINVQNSMRDASFIIRSLIKLLNGIEIDPKYKVMSPPDKIKMIENISKLMAQLTDMDRIMQGKETSRGRLDVFHHDDESEQEIDRKIDEMENLLGRKVIQREVRIIETRSAEPEE